MMKHFLWMFVVAAMLPTLCRAASEHTAESADVQLDLRATLGKVFTGVINFFRRHPDRPLVVPNPDTYWPNVHDGEYGIGAGGQARFLCSVLREMGVAVEPVYLGKPYPPIYRHALHTLEIRFGLTELKPEEVAAVGDSLTSDIAGARRAGMRSVLVLTGITTPEILSRAAPELRPDHVCEAIG